MVYLKLFLTAVFWGGTFIAGRSLAGEVSPYTAALIRFLIASPLLVLLCWRKNCLPVQIKRSQLISLIFLGFAGVFLYNVFFFQGLRTVPAGRGALIIANNPVAISLLSVIFLREKLSKLSVVGIVISVLGAIVVISRGNLFALSGGFGWGEAALAGCVASWGAYSVIGKATMRGLRPLEAVTGSVIIGTLMLAIPAIPGGALREIVYMSVSSWLSLTYLAVFGTVLGFVWFYEGIHRIGASRSAMFINFVPPTAVILGYLLLDEPITASLFVGTLLVCFGVYLTNRSA